MVPTMILSQLQLDLSNCEVRYVTGQPRVWRLHLAGGQSVLRLACQSATAVLEYETEHPGEFVQRAVDETWWDTVTHGETRASAAKHEIGHHPESAAR